MIYGHGGRRPGAGRKPKSAHLRSIDGGAGKRGPAPASASATAAVEVFDPPASLLTDAALLVWLELAPHAFQARTLTRATTAAFVMLCRNVVTERTLAAGASGGSDHRGMIQRVDAELLRFNLAPCGKAIYQPEEDAKPSPVNPLTRFTQRKRA